MKIILRLACALGAWCAACWNSAQAEIYDLGGSTWPSKNAVATYDGVNTPAFINDLVGATTFYNAGIYGEQTISANIEAGAIWGGPNGHQDLTLSTYEYTGQGALGEIDRHATWVGSVLGGLNYNELLSTGNNFIHEFGMAPATFLASGAIATQWDAPTPNPDGSIPSYSGSFETTQAAIYSTYNQFTNPSISQPINAQSPILALPGLFQNFTGTANVINSSWGFDDPSGNSDFTTLIDGFARRNPTTTIVVAAGNYPTPPTPANSVTGPASGYNTISVGATQNNLTLSDFNQVADFSARGPQDYYDPVHGTIPGVRAAVDIVAPGTSILAAYYGGQSGGNGPTLPNPDPPNLENDLYSYPLAGTSFAAPIVSGGVALLNSTAIQIAGGYTYNNISVASFPSTSQDARVIKAVLMNSADKLPGWDNGQHFDSQLGRVITTQSLDWSQGAGQINLSRAFLQYIDPNGTHDVPGTGGGSVAKVGWDLGALTLYNHNDYAITDPLQGGTFLDVTLTWFRDRDVDDMNQIGTDDGQANLDLQIWNSTFTNLLASSESIYNTSEELHFDLPTDGNYGIRVLYTDQIFGTPQDETYGVAWDEFSPVPEPSALVLLVLGIAACLAARTLGIFR
jgi:Subtilase family